MLVPSSLPTKAPTEDDGTTDDNNGDDARTETVALYTLGASLSMLSLFALLVVTSRAQIWTEKTVNQDLLPSTDDSWMHTPPKDSWMHTPNNSPSMPRHSQLMYSRAFNNHSNQADKQFYQRLRDFGFTLSSSPSKQDPSAHL